MAEKWVGADNGKSCVSNWVDSFGAHIGLYKDRNENKPCDVAISANLDGSVLLQVRDGDEVQVVDLRKLVRLAELLK